MYKLSIHFINSFAHVFQTNIQETLRLDIVAWKYLTDESSQSKTPFLSIYDPQL